jgi:hypothetical protein
VKSSIDEPYRFFTEDEIARRPPPGWIIDSLLMERGFGVLYGQPAVGKTFLALAWGHHITRGLRWADRAVQRGAVIYVAAEGVAGLSPRVRALETYGGACASKDRIRFLGRPVTLTPDSVDPDGVWPFIRAVQQQKLSPTLVIIDTLGRCLHGDENSSRDMGLLIRSVDTIRRELECGVLLLHHPGKRGESERGHGSLRGAADTMLEVIRGRNGWLELHIDKQKEAARGAAIRLKLVQVKGECDDVLSCRIEVVEDGVSTTEPGFTAAEQKALQKLASLPDSRANSGMWRKAFGASESQFHRIRRRLVSKQAVISEGVGREKYYTLKPVTSGE